MKYTLPPFGLFSFQRYLSSLTEQPDIRITQCDLIYNPSHHMLFDGAIEVIEKRQMNGMIVIPSLSFPSRVFCAYKLFQKLFFIL